jgi:hypothetical protein
VVERPTLALRPTKSLGQTLYCAANVVAPQVEIFPVQLASSHTASLMFNKEMDKFTHCDYSIHYTRMSEDTSVPFVTRKSCPSRKFKCRHKSMRITNIDNGPAVTADYQII